MSPKLSGSSRTAQAEPFPGYDRDHPRVALLRRDMLEQPKRNQARVYLNPFEPGFKLTLAWSPLQKAQILRSARCIEVGAQITPTMRIAPFPSKDH